MINEETIDVKFESNCGRDEFIKSVLNSVENKLTNEDLDELSELFQDL
ncbi:MAG: hypothetical protein Q4P11_00195 [Methanobrevibacter sp.]|nr:hypothetical protein [Methanobrevibacter sp.]